MRTETEKKLSNGNMVDSTIQSRLCVIETEIKDLKAKAAADVIAIGEKLIEAKAIVPHGMWLDWLSNNVDMSERTARNFMRLATAFPEQKRQAIADIDITKLYQLARIPEDERQRFLNIIDISTISTRELEYWVKVWADDNFRIEEMKRITMHLIEKGEVSILSEWVKMLEEYGRKLSIVVVEAERRVGELLSAAADDK